MVIRIAGAGCCLLDTLYPDADFTSPAFSALRSRRPGDGGLEPGRLVFAADLERFAAGAAGAAGAARPADAPPAAPAFPALIDALAAGAAPAARNVGGPSIVALVHAAQLLEGADARVDFYGVRGDDRLGEELSALLGRTPVGLAGFRLGAGRTPSTVVLSDPRWDAGRGERCFVNEIGAAAGFGPDDLDDAFYTAGIVALGGTALVPRLHAALPAVLTRARSAGALTVVNTVFDFLAERFDPLGAWPLGPRGAGPARPGPRAAYAACDLLIADRDEALRLAGEGDFGAALDFFEGSGAAAYLVTRGGDSVVAWSSGGRFAPLARTELPVSALAAARLAAETAAAAAAAAGATAAAAGTPGTPAAAGARSGDTTGCGDAFAGGAIASLAEQILARGPAAPLDLVEAAGWGIAAGAATLFTLGGVYYEERAGDQRARVEAFRAAWLRQIQP